MKPDGNSRRTPVRDSHLTHSPVKRSKKNPSNFSSNSFIVRAEFSLNRSQAEMEAEGTGILAGFDGFPLQLCSVWLRLQVISPITRLGRPSCSPSERCQKAHFHTKGVWKQRGNLSSFYLPELMMVLGALESHSGGDTGPDLAGRCSR